jgi:hypothetical protein
VWIGVACVALLLFAWQLLRARAEDRRRFLAFLLIAAVPYGVVVIARSHFAAGTGHPAEQMATISRYQYSASLGLVLASGWLLSRVSQGDGVRRFLPIGCLALWLLIPGASTWVRAESAAFGERSRASYARAIGKIERQVERGPKDAPVYMENRGFALKNLARAAFPDLAAMFVLTYPDDRVAGRSVYFVERDAAALADLRSRPGSRAARILISPEECGACLETRSTRR